VSGPGSARSRKSETETLAEKLAFNDPDRSTPVHDDICLWLDGRLRDEKFLFRLIGGSGWNAGYVSSVVETYRTAQLERLVEPYIPTHERVQKNREWVWEPVTPERVLELRVAQEPVFRMVVAAKQRWKDWEPPELDGPRVYPASVRWELAIGNERWVSGFIDVEASFEVEYNISLESDKVDEPPDWIVRRSTRTYAFEVKSTIPSLGELIRQIRYYEHKHRATYYVVAPDASHVTTLTAQGIGFVEYPSGTVHRPGR